MSTTINIIQGIKPGTIKITGYKGVGITGYAPVELRTKISDWFLPSHDEFAQIETQLITYIVGDFDANPYWTSSEVDATTAARGNYGLEAGFATKGTLHNVRACRTFTGTNIYNIRDVGQSGGLIFIKTSLGGGNYQYYEVAPSDQGTSTWSNITALLIGTTLYAIGEGQNNTTEIIGQAGHTSSAAKLCNDLIITI